MAFWWASCQKTTLLLAPRQPIAAIWIATIYLQRPFTQISSICVMGLPGKPNHGIWKLSLFSSPHVMILTTLLVQHFPMVFIKISDPLHRTLMMQGRRRPRPLRDIVVQWVATTIQTLDVMAISRMIRYEIKTPETFHVGLEYHVPIEELFADFAQCGGGETGVFQLGNSEVATYHDEELVGEWRHCMQWPMWEESRCTDKGCGKPGSANISAGPRLILARKVRLPVSLQLRSIWEAKDQINRFKLVHRVPFRSHLLRHSLSSRLYLSEGEDTATRTGASSLAWNRLSIPNRNQRIDNLNV